MSQVRTIPRDKWQLSILKFDRPAILMGLNVEETFPMTGDVYKLRSLQANTESAVKVHQVHAPFLRCSSSVHCCEGATLHRSSRTTVGIPCLSTDLVEGGKVCSHCEQLWAVHDDDGWYKLDKLTMPKAFNFYAPGKRCAFMRLPGILEASTLFDKEIKAMREIFANWINRGLG